MRRIPSPLRDVKKKAGRPSATCAFHPSRTSRCALSSYTTPFTPVPIARRLYIGRATRCSFPWQVRWVFSLVNL